MRTDEEMTPRECCIYEGVERVGMTGNGHFGGQRAGGLNGSQQRPASFCPQSKARSEDDELVFMQQCDEGQRAVGVSRRPRADEVDELSQMRMGHGI